MYDSVDINLLKTLKSTWGYLLILIFFAFNVSCSDDAKKSDVPTQPDMPINPNAPTKPVLTDTEPPAEVRGVTFSDFTNKITWLNPTDADFSKVLILRNTSSIVDAPSAGKEYTVGVSIGASEVVHDAKSLDFDLTDVREQDGEETPYRYKKYYYKIFTYDTSRNYATGVDISAKKNADKIIFVNCDVIDDNCLPRAPRTADGVGDGTSWSNAFSDLQLALTEAAGTTEVAGATEAQPVQIVVAAGVYKPRSTPSASDQDATFQLIPHIKVYGGFSGTETSLSERNWGGNKTILSGDLGGDDTDSNDDGIIENADDIKGTEMVDDATGMMTVIPNNSYTVVTGKDKATLDGFTITAGQSTASQSTAGQQIGFDNTKRSGGGMFNLDNDHLTLTNIIFSGNVAVDGSGGGMYNRSNHLTLMNIIFSDNRALYGGGLQLTDSTKATLTNVSFEGNSATATFLALSGGGGGGGMSGFTTTDLVLRNVTFSRNSASSSDAGGLLLYNGSMVSLINVIMWGNTASSNPCAVPKGNANLCSFTVMPAISYSLIQGCGVSGADIWTPEEMDAGRCGTDGGNNIDPSDSPFNTADDNLRLDTGSPAIDAGSTASNGGLPADITTDLAGNPRIVNDRIDMGAYESQ